jgi:uncharacterized repeat protein (TIGR03803 family)
MQRRGILISLIFCLTIPLTLNVWAHAKEKVLYQFTGGADGGSPSSSLLMDTSGNLYGTTLYGGIGGSCGNSGCGVVFELTPSANGTWQESVLYAFQGAPDGDYPRGNLVFDTSGNLYGTTSGGGSGTNCTHESGCGTIFELSPHSGSWTETVLYNFQNTPDGAVPAGLTFDAHGSLYGTAAGGGSSGSGVVYELSPPKQKRRKWTEKILYSFSGFGVIPNPGVVLDGQGNLYGTYYVLDVQFCSVGCGAVWQLTNAHGQWTETDIYDFLGGGNGGQPAAGVIRDSKGSLYGTGAEGGNNFGMVFELKHHDGQWKEKMLHNFCSRNNCADGALPLAGLVMDATGTLYGTTYWGGTCVYCGVVFKMTRLDNAWKETVLYDFTGGDGGGPQQNVILDAEGNLYGTADNAFGNGAGIVFEIMQ